MAQAVNSMEDLPVRQQERQSTDVICTICGVAFVLIMFAVASFKYNSNTLAKITFPTDSEGNTCGVEASKHPYLYFTAIDDTTKRLCVNQCPLSGDLFLSCKTTRDLSCRRNSNPDHLVEIYDSKLEETRMGLFCFPVENALKEKVLRNAGLNSRYRFFTAYDAIKVCLLVAMGLGIGYIVLVQLSSERLPQLVAKAGGIMFLVLAFITLFFNLGSLKHGVLIKVLLFITLFTVGAAVLLMTMYYKTQMIMCGLFLKHAAAFIKTKLSVVMVIPVFMLLFAGLLGVFLFQLLAFWSAGQLTHSVQDTYWYTRGNGAVVWTVLDFFELIIGLQFLKMACSFIISGYAINYYFGYRVNLSPIRYLFQYHWGSVSAGAFLLNFLTYPDILFDAFMPPDSLEHARAPGFCASCCAKLFGWLAPLFELARSESMAYINLTGLQYCNASRYCEYLNRATCLYNGNQSVNRLYRIGAHGLLTGLSVIIGVVYMLVHDGTVSFWACLFIGATSMFVVTFFISLHADASQALLITFLAQLLLCQNSASRMVVCPYNLRNEVLQLHNSAYPQAPLN